MSKTTTIAKMRPDGSVVEVLADGRERPIPDTPAAMAAISRAERGENSSMIRP